MRRPVKPFVTEYRGGSRRQAGQGHNPKTDPFAADPFKADFEPRAPEPWPPVTPSLAPSQQQEDSYEAALRAADSLFSGVRSPRTEASSSVADPAEAPPGGGRVLRVLDEPPSEAMMRLEAEHAPKKRGRKPGSKNKPKEGALAPAKHATRPVALEAERPALPAAAKVAAVQAAPVERIAAVAAHAAIPAARTEPGPRGERYAWVRTRLKPGQQWKRRLPKVAW